MNATLIERLKALAEERDAEASECTAEANEPMSSAIGTRNGLLRKAMKHTAAAATLREAIAGLEGERE